jgi:hypothetical protein
MFEFFSSKKNKSSAMPTELSDTFLNQALCAYVETYSNRDRLVQFMDQAEMLDQLPVVEARLNTVLKVTENFLWDQKDGVRWDTAFEQQLYSHLRQECPWLNDQGFAPLRSFSQWLCWHEGLNA